MKKAIMVVLLCFLWVGVCSAQSWELALNAGSDTLSGGIHYRSGLGDGYFKTGVTGFIVDDDIIEYKWGSLSMAAGNDTFLEGLRCEIGLRALFGDAEDNYLFLSGDVGAVAFTIHAGYIFPRTVLPIPIEIFANLSYAPDPLCFRDSEQFVETSVGLGVHIIRNATISVTYIASDVDMNNGPGDWNLDEDVVVAGISMRF